MPKEKRFYCAARPDFDAGMAAGRIMSAQARLLQAVANLGDTAALAPVLAEPVQAIANRLLRELDAVSELLNELTRIVEEDRAIPDEAPPKPEEK